MLFPGDAFEALDWFQGIRFFVLILAARWSHERGMAMGGKHRWR